MQLDKSETLDNFLIIKCDEETLHIRKFKGKEYVYKHNFAKFPYAIIRGSDKNISKIIKKNKFRVDNILLSIRLPSYNNFSKKLSETLSRNIVREKVYYNKTTEKIYFGDIDDADEDEDENDSIYSVSITKFFKLIDISKEDFIKKVKDIDLIRFEN